MRVPRSGDDFAHFAHLGGMATGLIYIHTDHRTVKFWNRIRKLLDSFPLKIKFDKENGYMRNTSLIRIDAYIRLWPCCSAKRVSLFRGLY